MYKKLVSTVLMFLVSLGLLIPSNGQTFGLFDRHKSVSAVNDEVLIAVKALDDGKAHYFVYKGKNTDIKFFVIKSVDGVLRAAFDACDVCFHEKKGYDQDGDLMICNNCGMKFHSTRINEVKGGCNPAPLDREVVGENLVIKLKDILPGSRFF